MKITKLTVTFFTSAIALSSFAAPLSAAPLTVQDKHFLSAYAKVHQALVVDDLTAAQKAAAALGSSGDALAKSKSLPEARGAFAGLSDTAKEMAAGQPGYYVVHCPMLKKDWVQTFDKIANPYGSAGMVSCGEIQNK